MAIIAAPSILDCEAGLQEVQRMDQLMVAASICNPKNHVLNLRIACGRIRQRHRYSVNTCNEATKEEAGDSGTGAGGKILKMSNKKCKTKLRPAMCVLNTVICDKGAGSLLHFAF